MSVSSIARITKSVRTAAMFSTAVAMSAALGACGVGGEEANGWAPVSQVEAATQMRGPSAVDEVTLRLEARAGQGKLGWALDSAELVVATDADVTLNSWDCGGRGRWVTLEGNGITFCRVDAQSGECGWASAIEIGGTRPEVNIGATFQAMRDGVPIANVTLVDRTETVTDWYQAEPIPPFVVELEIESLVDSVE